MTKARVPECFDLIDKAVLDDKDFYGARVREIVGKVIDVAPKQMEHIKVDTKRCNGCGLCVKLCPCGCYEMDGRVAAWRYGELCCECGSCQYICYQTHAIDWTYPEGGSGMIMHYS